MNCRGCSDLNDRVNLICDEDEGGSRRHGLLQGTGERMFKELSALAPFTMRFMCLLEQNESTQDGLECRETSLMKECQTECAMPLARTLECVWNVVSGFRVHRSISRDVGSA